MDLNAGEILRQGVFVVIRLAGPILLLSMIVGVLVAIFQAVTQIHDQTLGFVLKLLVTVLILFFAGGWMMNTLVEYSQYLFTLMR
ncbi:flagellar biosynthetic protein FliQ [uncultured Oscillibacter sp.]|uniref:flagellar biosynthetic protein FliQ n=1 Tax=uncultured Oscillibacter sp. TaxID=876091 RepID=UPI0025F0F8B9|nr:flagellar biosynthetic protein FliQ [uncultured Oscillibacter sp.]